MTIFRCIDFETTGLPSADERHAVCEVAYTDVIIGEDGGGIIAPTVSNLCNPGRPIPVEAMAIHHIQDRDVSGLLPPTEFMAELMQGADCFVAHNIDHEREFFGGGAIPWCCTYKSALRVWPSAPAHGLAHLRYFLKLDNEPDFDRDEALAMHRAGPDTYVTAFLFRALHRATMLEDMLKWSKGRALLSRCFFPKHKGKFWSDVAREDRGYLHWIVDKADDMDPDVRATAKYYLANPPPPRADGAQP